MTRYSTLGLAILASLMISGCGSEGDDAAPGATTSGREARDTMDSAMDDAQTAVDETVRQAENAMDEASRQAQEAMDDVNEAASEAASEVSGSVQEAMDTVESAADEATDQAAAAAAGAMAAAGVAAADDDDPCTLAIEVGDNIAYSTDAMSAPASCAEVSVTITHTGSLPAVAMGHNWVLLPEDSLESVATAGVAAGLEANYVPSDDRIVAATKVVGGGESDTITFSLGSLQAGVTYKYVCTFPGHWAVMQGTFTVSG